VGGINPPIAQCPSHSQQPLCPAVSYTAVIKAGRLPYETCNFTSKRSSMIPKTEFRCKSPRYSIPTNMETGLLSADSDSINFVELDLLETSTTVNGDESMVKADDLLDLELESMTFSQSTPLPSVSRVSYKGVCDSQATQSQVSHKLRCYNPCRSNTNSALLDITRPASSGALSSPDVIWDDDPMPERRLSPAPGANSSSSSKKL